MERASRGIPKGSFKGEIAEIRFSLLITHLKYIREAETIIPN